MNKYVKYLLSRFIAVFILVFFLHWIFNLQDQLILFCDISGLSLIIISWVLAIIIAYIGLISMNSFFLFINRNELKRNSKLTFLEYLRKATSWNYAYEILFEVEKDKKKYSVLFIILLASSVWLIKGNPIINNFYGYYFIIENIETGGYEEDGKGTIVPINFEVKHKNTKIVKFYDIWENTKIDKKGYIFINAGVFDGFTPLNNEFSFSKCLGFALLERLINTSIYFLLPFLIGSLILKKLPSKTINNGILFLIVSFFLVYAVSIFTFLYLLFFKEHLTVLYICLGIIISLVFVGILNSVIASRKKKNK